MQIEPIYIDIEFQPVIATLVPNIERNFIDIFSYGLNYGGFFYNNFMVMSIFYFLLIFCIIWEFYGGNEDSKIAFSVLITFFWFSNLINSSNIVFHFLNHKYDKINLLEHINYIKNNNNYTIRYEVGVGDKKKEKYYNYKCRDESLIEIDNIFDNTLVFIDVHYKPNNDDIRTKILNDKIEFSNQYSGSVNTDDSGFYYQKYIFFIGQNNKQPFFARNGIVNLIFTIFCLNWFYSIYFMGYFINTKTLIFNKIIEE